MKTWRMLLNCYDRAMSGAAPMLLLAAVAAAQVVSSSLTGTLLDPGDAAIPGVEITLTEEGTGLVFKTQSTTAGLFRFSNLQRGAYSIEIQASGFKTYKQQHIVVSSSETRDLGPIKLQLGSVAEQVSVTADVTPLQTASSEKSALVTGTQLSGLALKGRDFFGLVSLLPGVVDTRNRDNTSNASPLSGLYVNGLNNNTINYTIDGVTANDTGSNSDVHYNANMEAIAEVRVLTSNYQAEFGRKAGATISVVTRGGTREFHGSGYWSHRHEQFNANNFFNNRSNILKSPYRFNIGGYHVAGPVTVGSFNRDRSRLFFFFAQEYTRQRRDFGSQYRSMPTELERRGDFSQSFDTGGRQIPVYDPANNRSQFPGNVIPQNRIDATGRSILAFLPLPNYVDPDPNLRRQRNYAVAASGQYPRRSDTVRIDVNPTSALRVYYRLINEPENQDAPWSQWFTGANYLLEYSRLWRPGRGQAVSATYAISPTFVNEATYGQSYSHIYYNVLNPENLQRTRMNNIPQWFTGANGVMIPETSRAGYPKGWLDETLIPNVSFGGTPVNSPTIGLSNTPYENWNQIYSFQDNLTKMAGKHTIKAGVYVERTGKFATNQSGTSNLYRGVFDFGPSANNPYDSNNGFSNALLGNFQSYAESNNRTGGHFWFWNVESFVQDNWRVTRRLTLDLGVRVAYLSSLTDTNHTLAGFDPTTYSVGKRPRMYVPAFDAKGARVGLDPGTGAMVTQTLIGFFVPGTGDPANGMRVGGKDGYPSGMSTYKTPSISPRVGFAWDVFGNGKTAIRGGWGMFTDRPNTNETGEALQGNPPVTYTPTLYYGNLATFAGAAGYLAPSNVTFMYGDYHVPVTMNYSLGIQQSIGFGSVLEVSYVGNQARHLWWNRPLNALSMYARFDPKNADPTNPSRPLPDNFLRPYQGWGNLTLREFNNNSNYNSLQVSARRQFSRNLMFGGSYTFSKTMGYSDPSPYFSPRSWNYGVLGLDRTHVVSINYLYELPGVAKRLGASWLAPVTDGWRISGITSFASGSPFTPGLSTSFTTDITGSTEGARITVLSDPNLPDSERTFGRNFKTEAFALTPVRSFGNAGIGLLRGPGVNNWDMTLSKRVGLGLGEGRYVEFRWETYNTFNHTQFSGYDTAARFDQAGRQLNANFGAYNAARNPRVMAFFLRLAF